MNRSSAGIDGHTRASSDADGAALVERVAIRLSGIIEVAWRQREKDPLDLGEWRDLSQDFFAALQMEGYSVVRHDGHSPNIVVVSPAGRDALRRAEATYEQEARFLAKAAKKISDVADQLASSVENFAEAERSIKRAAAVQ